MTSSSPHISIIIACRSVDEDTLRCIEGCRQQDYPSFEILVLPDGEGSLHGEKVVCMPTGPVKPSVKRNIAIARAAGEILAFIDADAYPEKHWLSNAARCLASDTAIAGVTGPNLTPSEDSFMQKAGGDVLCSPVALGQLSRRYQLSETDFQTEDVMSCNFIVVRDVAKKLSGFDEALLTGEDYKLGVEIVAMGRTIIYSSSVCVYHHRRPLFLPHLRQIWNYGRDKGILMHEIFSAGKLLYFAPTAFTAWVVAGAAALPWTGAALALPYCASLVCYLSIVLAASLRSEDKRRVPYVFCGICATHFTYGIAFLRGLFTAKKSGPLIAFPGSTP